MAEALAFYRTPGSVTRLDGHRDFLNGLPSDPRLICQVVQGLLLHDLWVERYGTRLEAERVCGIPGVENILDRALQLDGRPLLIPRAPERRVIGCCREYATLLCAMLRHKGIPARSRCGFATYFDPGYFEDHWVCEYWHEGEGRWVAVDPQMDPFQRSFLQLDFDPLDLPPGRFLTAGETWRRCRRGEQDADRCGIGCDPKRFGLEILYGLWFVRGNLLRDFAALNKLETVPYLTLVARGRNWAPWRLAAARDAELSGEDWRLLDEAAGLAQDPDTSFAALRGLYEANPDLKPAAEIMVQA